MADQPEAAPVGQDVDGRRKPRKRGSTRTDQCATRPHKVRRKALEKLIFELRVQGKSVRAIDEDLRRRGYKTNKTEVGNILRTELENLGAERETKEQARNLSLARLEGWLEALAKRTKKGDDKAINTASKLDERIARYLGTEQPPEQSVKLTVLGQVNWIFDIITAELGEDAAQRVLRRISAESGAPADEGPGGPPG
jgi:hypothetical protein